MHYLTADVSPETYATQLGVRSDGNWVESETKTVVNISSVKIYQSRRWPGKNEDAASGTAPDMTTNDMTVLQMREISGALGQMALIYSNNTSIGPGPDWVKNQARNLVTVFTPGDISMKAVAQDMFNHFLNGSGADYRNSVLTQKAIAHSSTQGYINSVKAHLTNYLRENGGTPSGAIDFMENAINYDNDWERPRFNMSDDLLNGLTICVNDTWGSFVELTNYTSDGVTFSGTLKFTVYDHFGINTDDMIFGYDGLKEILVPNLDGFQAWYTLQHYTGCNGKYKPFIVYIETTIPFSGRL